MRIILRYILCVIIGTSITSCHGDIEEHAVDTHDDAASLNILMFGNSFTQDAVSYVPFILNDVAPDLRVNICIAYIGGCCLAQHCANLQERTVILDNNIYEMQKYELFEYSAGSSMWEYKGGWTAQELLKRKAWDIITFQQAGRQAPGDWDIYYAPYIYAIHNEVYSKSGRDVRLGWLSVHGAYASSLSDAHKRWEGTTANSKKVMELTDTQILFPFGTAIRNLSSTDLADIGDGVGMTADGAHLHEGLPCLCAAYSIAQTILNEEGLSTVFIEDDNTRPTKQWCEQKRIPGMHFGPETDDVVGITDDNIALAKLAAIQAVINPYLITEPEGL